MAGICTGFCAVRKHGGNAMDPYRRRGRIANQVPIDERPAGVEGRQRIGDWEGDTIIVKGHWGALVTLVERRSKYTVLQAVSQKTATAVRTAVVRGLRPYQNLFRQLRMTMDGNVAIIVGWPRIWRRRSTLRLRNLPGNGE
jgi:IS30 family transposase